MDPTRDQQPEADVLEQERLPVPEEPDPAEVEVPLEAEPADVAEQVPEAEDPDAGEEGVTGR
ncbi:hypothetical protein [Amycolatopsis cihanbeyliensis]|uniref:Uncharacterized protein n=1 Tax=Amycolatopsis cihanbeyliensis TaxID=1128664 RepID=A0A542CUD9_AMYCI|nr:hypothetical protein [Amycolatopsis cihanbeyliensis]TQI94424.1 hypothetical protein FB471_6589 [Amycolatopsis cihanbeyliensis]